MLSKILSTITVIGVLTLVLSQPEKEPPLTLETLIEQSMLEE